MNYLHVLTSSTDQKKNPSRAFVKQNKLRQTQELVTNALHIKCCFAQYLQILSGSQGQEGLYDQKKKKKKGEYHLLKMWFFSSI